MHREDERELIEAEEREREAWRRVFDYDGRPKYEMPEAERRKRINEYLEARGDRERAEARLKKKNRRSNRV